MAKVSIKININIRNVAGLRLCMIVILMCYRINFLKRCNFIIEFKKIYLLLICFYLLVGPGGLQVDLVQDQG